MKGVVRGLGALLVAGALATLIGAVSEHDAERSAWEQTRVTVGTDAYDARASDRAYERSRDARLRAGWSALVFVMGVWWVVATGAPRAARCRNAPTTFRRNAASLIDLVVTFAIGAIALIDDGESALGHALATSAPLMALVVHAAALQLGGATVGMRALGLSAAPVSVGRALLASFLVPLAIFGLFWPSWSAPHWRLGGVAPRGDAE